MPKGGLVQITEIPSQRWDLAIESLELGGPLLVLAGQPPVGLQRWTRGTTGDGLIHVSIFTTTEPEVITRQSASTEVQSGLGTLDRAVVADPRLQELFDRYGVTIAYVFDYGHGAVRLGDVRDDGVVDLL